MYHLQLIPLNYLESHFFVFNHHSIDPTFAIIRNRSLSTTLEQQHGLEAVANAMPRQKKH
jgi:hypothetical protein